MHRRSLLGAVAAMVGGLFAKRAMPAETKRFYSLLVGKKQVNDLECNPGDEWTTVSGKSLGWSTWWLNDVVVARSEDNECVDLTWPADVKFKVIRRHNGSQLSVLHFKMIDRDAKLKLDFGSQCTSVNILRGAT